MTMRHVHRHRAPQALRRQSGVALFVTIVLVTIGLVIASTLTYRHQLNAERNVKAMNSEQAILLALSAESWAKSILKTDAEDNNYDSFEDDWAQVIPVLPVEGGSMTGCIIDMQARFNLNNFGSLNEESFQQALDEPIDDIVEQYLNLREYVGLEAYPEYAAALVDWIDADTESVSPGSPEDAEYSLEDPARLAANSMLTSSSELVAVYGYSLADARALEDFVVALPTATAINVNTAPAGVLLNLSTLIDDFVVEGLIENRPYENTDEFYLALEEQLAGYSQADIQAQFPASLIDVGSQFFELRAQVQILGENIALTSLFQRGGRNEVRTLARKFEYIPDLALEGDEINPVQPLCDRNYGIEVEEEDT